MQIIENTRSRSFLIEYFRHSFIDMSVFANALLDTKQSVGRTPRRGDFVQDVEEFGAFVGSGADCGVGNVNQRHIFARRIADERKRSGSANGPEKIRLRAF